jgi:membrane-associated phospholipid phosphatase
MRLPRLALALVGVTTLAGPALAQAPSPGIGLPQSPPVVERWTPLTGDQAVLDSPAAPAAGAPRRGAFSELFAPLGGDMKRLATRDTALWLALGAGAAFAAHPSDRQVTTTLATSAPVEDALDAGSVIGNGVVQVGAALGTYVVGRVAGKPGLAHVGADLVRVQIVDAAMVQGIKFMAGRTRPDGTRYSFPSGHTSSAFATATVLQRHYGWKAGLPAYALAAYVGGSRLAENRHYLSDVLFGAALGVVAGRAVTFGHGARQFALTPIAVPGGAGIGVVHVGR